MDRRYTRRKYGVKRTIISLLVLSLFFSVCFPGLSVHAEETEVTEPNVVTPANADFAVSDPSDPSEEPTDPSEGSTDPSEQPADTSNPTELVEIVDPVKELHNKLMAAVTYEELDSMMEAMTNEEYQLLDQFTADQTAALEALIKQLSENLVQIYPDYSDVTLMISDSIRADGRLNVVAENLPTDGDPVYTWYKNGIAVERKKVTGDSYNVDEYGAWLNVALDGGSLETYTVKLTGTKVTDEDGNVTVVAVENGTVSNGFTVPYYDSLQNGSFEDPNNYTTYGGDVAYNGNRWEAQSQYMEGSTGLYWNTTGSCNSVEIINDNTNTAGNNMLGDTALHHGVLYAAEGDQAAEINSESSGALYQDVLTVPGSTMYWSMEHMSRPRTIGGWIGLREGNSQVTATDTMYVLIMPTEWAEDGLPGIEGPINNQEKVNQVIAAKNNDPDAYPGVEVLPITYTWYWVQNVIDGVPATRMYRVNGDGSETLVYTVPDGEAIQNADPWVEHNGTYDVPDDQYMTRYFFVAGATASGNNTVGNHVDDIWFSTQVPPPNPGYANLTINKTLVGTDSMTDTQLTELKKSLKFTVTGATDKTISGSEMHWTGNVGTYTIQNIVLGSDTSYSVTETAENIDGYTLTKEKDTDSGTLNDGGTSTAAFTNTYTPNTTFITLDKVVKGNMGDLNKGFIFKVAVNGIERSTTYTLNDGSPKVTISDIPLNATVTITETNHGEYELSSEVTNTESESVNENIVTFTASSSDGHDVVITNTYNANIDTGIVTDSMPYILIFAIAAGALFLLKKREFYSID